MNGVVIFSFKVKMIFKIEVVFVYEYKLMSYLKCEIFF